MSANRDNLHGFTSLNGTSQAAPHVTGAALMLMDAGLNPLEIKANLINTAEDMGSQGWDSTYGWGYLDSFLANFNKDYVCTDGLSHDGQEIIYQGNLLAGETVTLVWNAFGGLFGGTELSDLDLWLYDQNWNAIDYSLTYDENVEQVRTNQDLTNAKIKVIAYNYNRYYGAETFALAADSGLTRIG